MKKIDMIIDQCNAVKAQNIALTHALSGMLAVLPEDIRNAVLKQYDQRVTTFQVISNDGKTELDALAIQREQFATIRQRLFHI